MLVKFISKILFIFMFILTSNSYSEVRINIDKSNDIAFPIAITNFTNKDDIVYNTIKNDLLFSDKFTVLKKSDMPQKTIYNFNNINWENWKQSKADYIIIGTTTKNSSGENTVKIQLVSPLNTSKALFGMSYSNIPDNRLETLAHNLSNKIYKLITGKRGYFTTKLAYINVKNHSSDKDSIYSLVISDYNGKQPQTLLKKTSVPLSSPTWSADSKYISYVSYANGRMGIYQIELSTGIKTKLSSYKGINSSPAYSPKQNIMALALARGMTSYTQLWLLNTATQKLSRSLTNIGINTSPSFSPNGNQIIFNSNRGGLPQIYKLNLDEQQPQRIVFDGAQNLEPSYLPDGENIIFMHQQKRGGFWSIGTMNLENQEVKALTKGPVDKSPTSSPDGSMIIYTKTGENGESTLAGVSVDGNHQINLDTKLSGRLLNPSWSGYI